MYLYETHLHTSPVSKCGQSSVADSLSFYASKGYDGVFITNHFLDGNVNIDKSEPYEKQLDFFFSDYDEGVRLGKEIGIKVFLGAELSYGETDFLVYGLEREFYYAHPEIMDVWKDKRRQLEILREGGGFVVHAHPFREANYIDHIRIYPRSIDAVEGINACRTEQENRMAQIFAKEYGFPMTAGSDNHTGAKRALLAGIRTEEPLNSEADFIRAVKEGKAELFTLDNSGKKDE